MMLSDAFGYLWTALLLVGWIYVTIEFVRAAIKGRFWFWRRKANGKMWPPVRSETPVRFWLVWALMAGPFLLITSLILTGGMLALFQR
jgi:hypothetical protein